MARIITNEGLVWIRTRIEQERIYALEAAAAYRSAGQEEEARYKIGVADGLTKARDIIEEAEGKRHGTEGVNSGSRE